MKKSILLIAAVFSCRLIFAEQITFKADSMNGSAGNASRTILQGNAQVTTDSMEISADLIELTGKDFQNIKATGNVKGKNTQSKMEFSCGILLFNRQTNVAVLQNEVSLIDTENSVDAKAEIIEYNQDSQVAVMQVGVELKQKDNVCRGAYVVYKKNEQQLEMNGNPSLSQGKDTFRAQNIRLNLETQEILLDGRVKGSITTTQKDKTDNTEQQEPEEKK